MTPGFGIGKKRWLRRAAVLLFLYVCVSAGLSQFLRTERARAYLNGKLAASFGRPVEASRYDFSWMGGALLQADYVSVAEDPRFGHEYFLRAERLTASPRWRSLVRGRLELGRLSFTRPSLNLVRNPDGHWNVESWLPPPLPARGTATPPARAATATRLYHIQFDGGRINFKRGVDKHPFALVDVKGRLEQEAAGRWRMDLEAHPVRAAVVLQETGTIRLRGRIAGTSARLQPAELFLTWQEASLADALRLAEGNDFGVRGQLAVELSARSEAPASRVARGEERIPASGAAEEGSRWFLGGTARLENVHRWDLPQRAGNPALNLSAEAQWRPGQARIEFSQCLVEAPRSSILAIGNVQWAPVFEPEFHILSSGVHLGDVLAWYRAFRPDVAADLAVEGDVRLDIELGGWPLRLARGLLSGDGAAIRAAGLPAPIRVGRIVARVRSDRPTQVELEPTTVLLGARPARPSNAGTPQDNALLIRGAIQLGNGLAPSLWEAARFDVSLAGQTDRVQDLWTAAQAFRTAPDRGWSAEGPAAFQLRWQGSLLPFDANVAGRMELRGTVMRAPFLNQPVSFTSALMEWRPTERRVTLSAAQGFGARWKGAVWKSVSRAGGEWEFDLSADRLLAADLDHWLGPRARPGLLQRIVPFMATDSAAEKPNSILDSLHARGRFKVDEFVLPPVRLRRLHAQLELQGRNAKISQGQAEFFDGMVRGSFEAQLTGQPFYRLLADFERVNLALLSGATSTLKDRFAGTASGRLSLVAQGIGRESLLRSLEGTGAVTLRGVGLRGLDLKATYAAGAFRPGSSQFSAGDAKFSLAAGTIQVKSLRLAGQQAGFAGKGSVSFSRALDLELFPADAAGNEPTRASRPVAVRLKGLLEAPEVSRREPEGGKPVKK